MNLNWLVLPTLIFALLLFLVGYAATTKWRGRIQRILIFVVFVVLSIPGNLFVIYYLHGFDDVIAFYEFRALPFIELSAAGMGLLAGLIAAYCQKIWPASRLLVMAALSVGIAIPYLKPVFAPVGLERFVERWQDGVSLQSTPSSCGAASAATLLKALGYASSERDLARECFTYRGGTENWYIARAFRQRGYSVRYRIEHGLPANLHPPAIAGVRIANFGHFIAILSNANGLYVTGDPLVGRREFTPQQLMSHYSFTGFFMEIQAPPAAGSANRVVVEKHARTLTLYQDEKWLAEYPVALGVNSNGHKQQEGDGRTPEGNYVLDYKKANSAFYKAIHISYPNAQDIATAHQRGVAPGGEIMLHGQKNYFGWAGFMMQRFDWTQGCIALSNADMDAVWTAVNPGAVIQIKP